MSKQGYPSSNYLARFLGGEMAKSLSRATPWDHGSTPSNGWVKAMLDRNPEIAINKAQENMESVSRKPIFNIIMITSTWV